VTLPGSPYVPIGLNLIGSALTLYTNIEQSSLPVTSTVPFRFTDNRPTLSVCGFEAYHARDVTTADQLSRAHHRTHLDFGQARRRRVPIDDFPQWHGHQSHDSGPESDYENVPGTGHLRRTFRDEITVSRGKHNTTRRSQKVTENRMDSEKNVRISIWFVS